MSDPNGTSRPCSPRSASSSRRRRSSSARSSPIAAIYDRAEADPEAFWAEQAERLTWFTPLGHGDGVDPALGEVVRGWHAERLVQLPRPPRGGRRRRQGRLPLGGRARRHAHDHVSRPLRGDLPLRERAASRSACGKGDRVAIYLGMVPELPVAMLACARIGAAHSVVFGGFSAESLKDRINDAEAKVLITADGGVSARADRAAEGRAPTRRVAECPIDRARRDGAPHGRRAPVPGRAATSGTTSWSPISPPSARPSRWTPRTSSTCSTRAARPASRRASRTRPAATSRRWRPRTGMIFDIHEDDVYWCAADIGWVTGHSYIVYGPLANHTTGIIYEGAPGLARQGPAAGTIAETLRGHDPLHRAHRDPRVHALGHRVRRERTTSRRCACSGSVGEPINPEAWVWYWKYIGGERCPVVDTWWQTETGAILITPLPGRHRR